MTINELIYMALQVIGIKGEGQTLDADDVQLALDHFNVMFDSLALSRYALYPTKKQSITLTSGTYSYTIGESDDDSADFDYVRPIQLLGVYLEDADLNMGSGELFRVGTVEFERMSTTSMSGSPGYVNYEPEYPFGILNFYPTPDAAYTVKLVYTYPFDEVEFEDITDDLSVPPGWKDALLWNLAARLTAPFAVPLTQPLMAMAESTLRKAKSVTASQLVEPVNLGLQSLSTKRIGRFNVWTGQ